MSGTFRKLVGFIRWIVCFFEEVNRGIAVGRGYAPVRKNTRRRRGASRTCGSAGREERVARSRVLAHRSGRWGADGRT